MEIRISMITKDTSDEITMREMKRAVMKIK